MFLAKILTGNDGCDCWSSQGIWDAFLQNVKIVISTYAVLCDALVHGFVRLSSLALLVYDEAHHCRGKHAANSIMQKFYHQDDMRRSSERPALIGLTASPAISGKHLDDLRWVVSSP